MPPSFPLTVGRYDEIAGAVAARLETSRSDDPLRPWSVEVVVASHGVAEAIARELAGRIGGVAGLQLQTIDALARRIVNAAGEFPRVATDAERRLAMRSAVRAIDEPMMQSRGIAAMLERSYRDVRDSGLTLDDLRRRTRGATLRHVERTHLIVRAWTEYERLIALTGAIDPAALLSRAVELIDRGASVTPQIVVGFYDLTGAQQAIVEALARKGTIAGACVPAGESDAYRFAQPLLAKLARLGAERRGALLRAPTGKWSVTEYDRRDVEIRETCASIAALLASGTPPHTIGIVARALDPADVHLFNRYAAQYGFSTTATGELPLIGHRIGRGIAAILRLRERVFPRADVLEIVRDGFRAQTRISVDRADREARKARITGGGSADLEPFRARSLVLGDYANLVREFEEVTAPLASPALRGSEWSDFLVALAGRFSMHSESDLAAAAAVESIAATFARADRMNLRFDIATVMDAIEQATLPQGEVRSSAPAAVDVEMSEPGGAADLLPADRRPLIWLGDVMRFRGRSFEHLFAVRMQDEIFPQRRLEDPLVPDSDRRALSIRQIGDGRDEERLLFQLMLDGARSEIHFSFAGSDGFGKMLRPSQLLKNFVIEQRPESKQDLLRDFSKAIAAERSPGHQVTGSPGENGSADIHSVTRQPGDPATVLRQLQLLARSGTNGVFDGFIADPALREHFVHALEHVSPTQLEDFGECPQKFLLKFVLKVESVEDPDRELQINPRDKGSLDHRILENFYRSMTADEVAAAAEQLPQLPAALAKRLEETIEAEFDRLDAAAPAYNQNVRAIERRATRRILRDFVVRDLADLAENNLRPTWFEYSFGDKYQRREGGATHPEPFVVTAAGVPIHVEGQVDRIDVGNEVARSGGHEANLETSQPRDLATRVRIVDYKSGKALRHTRLSDKIDRGVRLQLPLYAMAVASFFGLDPGAVSGTIKPLVASPEHKPASYGFALADHDAMVRATLEIFASSVAAGRFPAFPDQRDFESCKYCPVNHSCRTKHDAVEAWIVTRQKDPRTLLQSISGNEVTRSRGDDDTSQPRHLATSRPDGTAR